MLIGALDRYAERVHYAEQVDKEQRRSQFFCPICNDDVARAPFLVDVILIFKDPMRGGYERVCKPCFDKKVSEYPSAGIYSGFPRPWLDLHFVLSTTKIEGYKEHRTVKSEDKK